MALCRVCDRGYITGGSCSICGFMEKQPTEYEAVSLGGSVKNDKCKHRYCIRKEGNTTNFCKGLMKFKQVSLSNFMVYCDGKEARDD